LNLLVSFDNIYSIRNTLNSDIPTLEATMSIDVGDRLRFVRNTVTNYPSVNSPSVPG